MDQILEIFTQLGVDQSVFYQFALFIIIFISLKYVLFNKLLFVVKTREEKTTKLDGDANTKFNEAEKLAAEYLEKVESFNIEAQENLQKDKARINEEESVKIKLAEDKISAEYENRKKDLATEMASQREVIMKDANNLSGDLVQKLTS